MNKRKGDEATFAFNSDTGRAEMKFVKVVPKFLKSMGYQEKIPTTESVDKEKIDIEKEKEWERDLVAEDAIAQYLASQEKERQSYEEAKAAAAIKAMEAAEDAADEAAGIVRFRKPTSHDKVGTVNTATTRKKQSDPGSAPVQTQEIQHRAKDTQKPTKGVKKSLLSFDADEV